MVNRRIYVAPGTHVSTIQLSYDVSHHRRQTMNRNLRSRLYSSSDTKARPVDVTTRCAGQLRFPFVESVVGNTPLQSYVHDCVVTVIDGRQSHRYVVFFKRHCALPSNGLISRLCCPFTFRGDIVVMRIGSRHGHVVNMRPGDAVVANLVIAE